MGLVMVVESGDAPRLKHIPVAVSLLTPMARLNPFVCTQRM